MTSFPKENKKSMYPTNFVEKPQDSMSAQGFKPPHEGFYGLDCFFSDVEGKE